MIAIVVRRCQLAIVDSADVTTVENAIVQFRTFGVQLFFVNSGFLMADHFARGHTSTRSYLKGRLLDVLIPWLVWVTVYIVVEMAKDDRQAGRRRR